MTIYACAHDFELTMLRPVDVVSRPVGLWSDRERDIDSQINSYGEARVKVDPDTHEDETAMMAPPGSTFAGFEDEGGVMYAVFERSER